MGDFTLGCLLGQYDKAQSFDVASNGGAASIGGWSWVNCGLHSGRTFVPAAPANTHSSDQGLKFVVGSASDGQTLLQYEYRDEAFARWFPEVTTHDLRISLWARTNVWSGKVGFTIAPGGPSPTMMVLKQHASALQYHSHVTTTQSDGSGTRPNAYFRTARDDGNSAEVYADDVLAQVDPIVLHPEFDFREQAALIRSQHRTRAGELHTYLWDRFSAWQVPLRYVSNSHAALINWWWEGQLDLAFTLDASDTEAVHVVRIVNERQPIGGKIRPFGYAEGGWAGTLELESIRRGGLAY